MKITVITQYYKPEMGAPQNRLYEMCRGLKDNGADVSIITGMPNYPTGKIFDAYKGKFTMTEILDGMEVKRYWLFASNARKVLPRIWNMISFSMTVMCALRYLKKRKNDYIIVESPPLTLGESALLLAKWTGSKLIMNVSDLWPLSARELGAMSGDGLAYKTLEKLEHHLYKKSQFCMGQSQEIVDYIRDHGAKEVYLFRNGVDPTRFEGIDVKPEEGKVKLVYAGLLGFAQGIADICKSVNFAELGMEFHIYGAGGEQTEIETTIAEHPNRGIYYHGVVSRQELPSKLKEANMTLIPLVKNIFGAVPSKIYESMAAGLPIMFVGEGEGARIVKENNIGLVAHSKDYKALEENIKYAVNHPEEMKTMSDNCKDCAENKFNRPKQIKSLYEFLLEKM
jgi:glycosyltransferase involved in cell wall biosynthesis